LAGYPYPDEKTTDAANETRSFREEEEETKEGAMRQMKLFPEE